MWNLTRIKAKNFQTFKDIDIDVIQNRTSLIFGENRDNLIQKSNGSGKSGIIEAITVGTRGTPMRNVRIDEIINDKENSASVTVEYFNDETNELLSIRRKLFRKSSNEVSIYMERDGSPVDPSEYEQSSVSEYNKFIFDTLGITEDEFLNNFVLSKHRYVSFMDASDRVKKETINKLSNANIIDPSIEQVKKDIELKTGQLTEIDLRLASVNGAISVLEEQLDEAIESKKNDDGGVGREQRIKDIEKQILDIESEIHSVKEPKLQSLKSLSHDYDKIDDVLSSMSDNITSKEAIDKLNFEMNGNKDNITVIQVLSEFLSLAEQTEAQNNTIKEDIHKTSVDINSVTDKIKEKVSEVSDIQSEVDGIDIEIASLREHFSSKMGLLNEEQEKLNESKIKTHSQLDEITSEISQLIRQHGSLSNIVAGSITCPKCKYQFVLDSDKSLDDVKGEMEALKSKIDEAKNKESKFEAEQAKINEDISVIIEDRGSLEKELNDKINEVRKKQQPLDIKISQIKSEISKLKSDSDTLKERVNEYKYEISSNNKEMLDDMDEYADKLIDKNKKDISDLSNEITFDRGSIQTLRDGIEALKNATIDDTIDKLRASLSLKEEERLNIKKEREVADGELEKIINQEAVFNGFKTYLANIKIDALSYEINEFLTSIGSDLRVRLNGYTKTKTNKVRDKISVLVIRDGVNFGSFAKLSEGEKATIQLSTILALQKLINIGAEDTKGLNLLVIDEILDTVDGNGLSHIFDTLMSHDITSLVVSHGGVAENFPHKIIVTKENGVSSVSVK